MSRMKQIHIIVLFIVFITNIAVASNWREDAETIDISGGEDHTLVLTRNKWAWACGPNSWYQLGIGDTTESQKTLVRVHGGAMNTPCLQDINDIEAGWKHSLALDVNSFVWSWGDNEQGQLGVGEGKPHSNVPVRVLRGEQVPANPWDPDPNLARIVDISAGRSGEHSLAVDVNGYAYGWGYNEYGQCGNAQSGNSKLTPVYVHRGEQAEDPRNPDPNLTRIVAVSAGEWHSMALEGYDPCDPNLDGRVYTWGDNAFGEYRYGRGVLGDGTDVLQSTTPVIVLSGEQDPNHPNAPLKHIVAISAGWDHSMALEKYEVYDPFLPNFDPNHKGRVYTWGNNGDGYDSGGGRLGNGFATDSNSTPVLVRRGEQEPEDPCNPYPYLSRIIAVSAGEAHSMALDVNGYVYCWGDNQHGQLGNGCDDPCATPVRVVGEDGVGYLENIVAISAGYWHSLAIDANGTIWTWGKASAGRLGLGNKTIDCNTPHPIPVVYNVTQETFAFAIQTAIEKANDAGDTLEASPGTYYEDVDFLTKMITLRSADPNNAEVVEDTVIQGSGGLYIPAVQFTANPNSRLSGFTIANNDYGIKCDSSSPTISNSVIANCGGHGLYCVNNSAVEVTNCTISGNGGSADPKEDGINCSGSDIMLSHCLITANAANGIYCNQSTAGITNCTIEENEYMGVYAAQTTLAIMNSTFSNNGDHGIHVYSNCDLTIAQSLIKGNGVIGLLVYDDCGCVLDRSIVCDNGADGVEMISNNSLTLTNNWIYRNGRTHLTWRDGIWFESNNASAPVVRNNTIFGNPGYGIEVATQYTDPTILNCIIYANGSGDLHRDTGTFATVNYCCLQNPRGTNNITSDPCFVDADVNNFHLAADSLCIDAGDPGFEPDANETDIDGNPRVMGEEVDIGADEFWRATDFSGDGLVNFIDYAMLARHWHQTDADPGYSDAFDLWDDDFIDFNDVLVLCEDWLSKAEWSLTGSMPLMAGRSGGGMTEGLSLQAAPYELSAVEEKSLIAEPVDVKKLLDWLAEIWLDPEVRERIDAEAWLKLYESLKE